MATVMLKNRHSLQGLNLQQLIDKIRDGNIIHVDTLASFQEGKTLADLSIEELKSAFQDNLISEETLDAVLEKARRAVNLDNCRLAVHQAICFANDFGQPQGHQLHDSSASGTKNDDETEYQRPTLKRKIEDLERSKRNSVQSKKLKTGFRMSTITSLFEAVKTNDILTVNYLIQSDNCDVNIVDSDGVPPLHLAVETGQIDMVRSLIVSTECDVNILNNCGSTPLHIAVENDNIEIVRCLIENTKCDVNIKNIRGYTPLHIAVLKGNMDIVKCLIQNNNCIINIQDIRGNTPLHIAVEKRHSDIVRCLIVNTDVNIKNNDGDTHLHIAIQSCDIDIVRCLLENNKWYINIKNSSGNTPLHIAVDKGNIDIVRCLIENAHCDVNIKNSLGNTPLHITVLTGDIDIVSCLLENNTCNINIKNSVGNTPLYIAVEKRHIDIVSCLLKNNKCNINIKNSDGDTPLHIAVSTGAIDIVKCLTKTTSCNVNIHNNDGNVLLHVAVLYSYKEIVRYLLEHTTCDVNIQNNVDYTPLHTAVKKGNIEIVRCILIHANCNVNIQARGDKTPLHTAVSTGDIDIVRCLIENTNCNVNMQDSDGNTPLHIAVDKGSIDIVRCLIENNNCNINIQDNIGYTPLYRAVEEGNIHIVGCLVKNTTCVVNIQDSKGDTPLHIAVQLGNIQIVRCLFEEGNCNGNIQNQEGYSPFSTTGGLKTLHKIAECHNVELVLVLIQHNVDVLTKHVNNHLQLVKFILSENDFRSLWFFIQNGLYINSLSSSGENIVHLLANFEMDFLDVDFSFLFDYGLDFNLINNVGNSPLMVASLLNNLPFIQFLAALPSIDVNRQNHQGHTAFHLCVIGFTLIKEDINMTKVNSIVKVVCAHEYYPRYLACIDTLLSSLNADVNIKDNCGKTVLMLACMKNDRKLLETLLIHGADVNIVDNHGRSALQYIDLTNNIYDLTCFNLLLSHGCRQSFNQPCLNGNTIIQNVLKFTPLWQIDDIVNFLKFLVFKNVNLQLLTSDGGEITYGQLSLEEFSSESRHALRQILYLSGGPIKQITKLLHFEVEENYEASLPESVREEPRKKFYLFANNLSLKEICRRVIRQNTGLKAIHDLMSERLACPPLNNCLKFLEKYSLPVPLISYIDDFNSNDLNKENDYDDDGDDDYDSYDLNKDKDDYENDYLMYQDCKYFNFKNNYGFTPLHRAVKERKIEFVKSRIKHTNCKVNIHDIDGYTPLHIAVWRDDIEIVKCITQHNTCNVNLQDVEGYTPLHIAVWWGNIDSVRYLIENTNCDVNIRNSGGNTPLHIAVLNGNIETVRYLIENADSDVNILDNDGKTPLYRAVYKNAIEISKCLLNHTST